MMDEGLVREALAKIKEAEKLLERALEAKKGAVHGKQATRTVPVPPVLAKPGEKKEEKGEAAKKEKKGFLQRLQGLAEKAILSDLPVLRKETGQILPESLLRYYFTLFHRREYTPLEEARIRNRLVILKEDDPEQYKQLEQLLRSPPPWNILAVAVLDNMANKRGMPISLSKLVSEYNAVQTRDPFYFVSRLREEGYEDEASLFWTLWHRDTSLAGKILETFYSMLTPEPTRYTAIPDTAVDQAAKAIREAVKQRIPS